jgi:hypothetical protein
MNNIDLLISSLPKEGLKWALNVSDLLHSSSIEEKKGNPYTVSKNFVYDLYLRRINSESVKNNEHFGLNELLENLQSLTGNINLSAYGLKNNHYVGECFLFNGEMIGCAFIKKGRSHSVRGLSLVP